MNDRLKQSRIEGEIKTHELEIMEKAKLKKRNAILEGEDYLIWWTNGDDYEKAEYYIEERINDLEYVRKEFVNMDGRPTRGRLWIPEFIKLEAMRLFDETSNVYDYCLKAGGIVFKVDDFDTVIHLPGVITNLDLKEIL